MADDLVQFLRDRLDEDEAAARAVGADRIETGPGMWETKYLVLHQPDGSARMTAELDADIADHIARHDPARVLAEVEAKRRIVEQADLYLCDSGPMCGYRTKHGHNVLLLLALPYADHPDYRAEWRP